MSKRGCRGAAGFLLSAAVLFLVCPGGTCNRVVAARATAEKHEEVASGTAAELTYEVDFLFGRHGISCTNLVEKFSPLGWYDVGRGLIGDPMLTGIGEIEAGRAKEAVASYLESNGLEVDAVQASVLGRAIQTAMLTYPEHAKPVDVVPHMRESARGASNLPTDRATQVEKLTGLAPQGTNVNYHWALSVGVQTPGDWEKFLDFLTQVYLPDFLQRTGKPHGSKIVIAVTTHSLLMAHSPPLKATCGHFWDEKPRTNQVVHVKYDYTVRMPESSDLDVTPTYTLSPTAGWECKEVYTGSTLDQDELCMSDIGQSCIAPIHEKAWSNLTRFVREAKMHAAAERIEHLRGKVRGSPDGKKTGKWNEEIAKKEQELQAHLQARCANGEPAMVENLLGVGTHHLTAYRTTLSSLSL